MPNGSSSPQRRRTAFLGWYGLALGLLLAALQAARYRFSVVGQATEFYIALVALIFTALGIWAGLRFASGRKQFGPANPQRILPLSGDLLEQRLEKLGITRREYEVLQLIAEGLSNQEIAGRMFVSLNTVKTHTSNLFAKLDAQRRTQAVEKARALGLLPLAHPNG